jgi:hypothetical protein
MARPLFGPSATREVFPNGNSPFGCRHRGKPYHEDGVECIGPFDGEAFNGTCDACVRSVARTMDARRDISHESGVE